MSVSDQISTVHSTRLHWVQWIARTGFLRRTAFLCLDGEVLAAPEALLLAERNAHDVLVWPAGERIAAADERGCQCGGRGGDEEGDGCDGMHIGNVCWECESVKAWTGGSRSCAGVAVGVEDAFNPSPKIAHTFCS